MSYAAHADDDRSRGPWCAQPYRHGPWHPGLIVLMILGFIFWWPLGLAFLAYILWSKGMICGGHWQRKMDRMQEKMERMRGKMNAWGGPPSSGNHAFDEYRAETLHRLEEEEKEFREFLERLRAAKDKSEFDQFMADRRNRGGGVPQPGSA
jgi:Protein of unknown function (DUF2852)